MEAIALCVLVLVPVLFLLNAKRTRTLRREMEEKVSRERQRADELDRQLHRIEDSMLGWGEGPVVPWEERRSGLHKRVLEMAILVDEGCGDREGR